MFSVSFHIPFFLQSKNRPKALCLFLFVFSLAFVKTSYAESPRSWLQGETLIYRVSWGIITAGTASLETKVNGENIELRSLAHNNGAFKSIYPVADTIFSSVHRESFLPTYFKKIIHEGAYHDKSIILFDRKKLKAQLSDTVFLNPEQRTIKRFNDTTITIFGNERCILSAFYYVRGLNFDKNKKLYFSAVSGKKRYDLQVVIHGRERINTKFGYKNCIKLEPILKEDSLFKSVGRLFIWLTDDAERLPVLMRSEIKVGSIKAELIDYYKK